MSDFAVGVLKSFLGMGGIVMAVWSIKTLLDDTQ
jgi:hypothetical protein